MGAAMAPSAVCSVMRTQHGRCAGVSKAHRALCGARGQHFTALQKSISSFSWLFEVSTASQTSLKNKQVSSVCLRWPQVMF